jgi:outer membrane PBP1 activator LpoA protein
MEGLQYSEIPMLAGSNPALQQQALAAVRNDYSLARLYAMGADAWSLANHFTQMRQVPGFELNGNTGDLTATQDCVINRKLSWLKYQQGKSSRPAKQTDRRCLGKPGSPLAGRPGPAFYRRQRPRAWRRN